jgi:hypothetical protein
MSREPEKYCTYCGTLPVEKGVGGSGHYGCRNVECPLWVVSMTAEDWDDVMIAIPNSEKGNPEYIVDQCAQKAAIATGLKPTPAALWRKNREPDPHGATYDCERAALTLGAYTDDELANAVFLHGNETPSMADVVAGKALMPIVYLTAAKERIRWLSRRLSEATDPAAVLVPTNIEQAKAMILLGNKWLEQNTPGEECQAYDCPATRLPKKNEQAPILPEGADPVEDSDALYADRPKDGTWRALAKYRGTMCIIKLSPVKHSELGPSCRQCIVCGGTKFREDVTGWTDCMTCLDFSVLTSDLKRAAAEYWGLK